jgi:hypothetical protein
LWARRHRTPDNKAEKNMAKLKFAKQLTALIVIDPYNDFISEGEGLGSPEGCCRSEQPSALSRGVLDLWTGSRLRLPSLVTAVQTFMTARLHSVRVEIEAAEAKERIDDGTFTVRFETIEHDIDSLHASES